MDLDQEVVKKKTLSRAHNLCIAPGFVLEQYKVGSRFLKTFLFVTRILLFMSRLLCAALSSRIFLRVISNPLKFAGVADHKQESVAC